jgi:hypothetical protein
MKLVTFISKRRFSFLQSFETFWEDVPGRKYFWTITPNGYVSDDEFCRSWRVFQRRILKPFERCGGLCGLRVFEPFKSGFLHCHMLVNRRLDIEWMNLRRWGTSLGNLDVRRAVATDGQYLAKYMFKAGKLPKGRRAWGTFGNWQKTRVRDVEVHSEHADLLRGIYAATEVTAGPGEAVRRWIAAKIEADRIYRARCMAWDDQDRQPF